MPVTGTYPYSTTEVVDIYPQGEHKVERIYFRRRKSCLLEIQFQFTEGLTTPIYQSQEFEALREELKDDKQYDLQSLDVDTTKILS